MSNFILLHLILFHYLKNKISQKYNKLCIYNLSFSNYTFSFCNDEWNRRVYIYKSKQNFANILT